MVLFEVSVVGLIGVSTWLNLVANPLGTCTANSLDVSRIFKGSLSVSRIDSPTAILGLGIKYRYASCHQPTHDHCQHT